MATGNNIHLYIYIQYIYIHEKDDVHVSEINTEDFYYRLRQL